MKTLKLFFTLLITITSNWAFSQCVILNVQITSTDASEYNACDAIATIWISDTTAGSFYFGMSNDITQAALINDTTYTFTNLCAGDYNFYVWDLDSNSCSCTGCFQGLGSPSGQACAGVTIGQPIPYLNWITYAPMTGTQCWENDAFSYAHVEFLINFAGNAPSFEYQINSSNQWNPITPGQAIGLSCQDVSGTGGWIEIRDSYGNTINGLLTSTSSYCNPIPTILVNDLLIQNSCNNDCKGKVTILTQNHQTEFFFATFDIVINGPTNINYTTSLNEQNITFDSLCPGVYNGTITNTTTPNCSSQFTFTIGEHDTITPTITTSVNSCNTICNGEINISASGGTAPFEYSFDNGNSFSSNNTNDELCDSTYLVLTKDANGCIDSSYVSIDYFMPSEVDTQEACDSLLWIDGNTYYSDNNTASHILLNSNGCDSLVSLNLIINHSSLSEETINSCGSYNWNGTIVNSEGIYYDSLTSQFGCDSILVLNFNNNQSDVSITSNGSILTVNEMNGDNYRWFVCENGFNIITGATEQSYTVLENNDYAVEVSKENCIDTSLCFTVDYLYVEDLTKLNYSIYPNPNSGSFTVKLGQNSEKLTTVIYNVLGKQISSQQFENTSKLNLSIDGPNGVYFVQLTIGNKTKITKIIKL